MSRSVRSLETWEARLRRMFSHAPEESFEGQIDAHRHVLQHLGMDAGERGPSSFQQAKGGLLLIERWPLPGVLIHVLAFRQQVVIQPTALFQCLVKHMKLFLVRKETVRKHFTHTQNIAQIRTNIKKSVPPADGGLFIPMAEARGLLAR